MLAPDACAASSIKKSPFSSQISLISSISGGINPAKCTTITPLVLAVIFFLTSSGSKHSVSSFISTKIGLPPAKITAFADATKLLVGTIISPPLKS